MAENPDAPDQQDEQEQPQEPQGVPQDPQSQSPGSAQPPAQGSHVHPPRPGAAKPGTGQGVQPGQVIEKELGGFGGGSEGRGNISETQSGPSGVTTTTGGTTPSTTTTTSLPLIEP